MLLYFLSLSPPESLCAVVCGSSRNAVTFLEYCKTENDNDLYWIIKLNMCFGVLYRAREGVEMGGMRWKENYISVFFSQGTQRFSAKHKT